MPSERDPFDILRGYDPVDREVLPSADSLSARKLFEQITTSSPSSLGRRRVLLAVAILAIAAVAATTWAALTRDVSAVTVTCYATTSLDGNRVGVVSENVPSVEACIDPWADGPLTNPDVSPGEVPPLSACVTDDGVLAVFPTDDLTVCADLGLAEQNPSQPTEGLASIAAARDAIVAYIAGEKCASIDDAEVQVRTILGGHGLTDWTIESQPPRVDRPCASISFDVDTQTVILVPHRPRP
jgi:hypothetical protein